MRTLDARDLASEDVAAKLRRERAPMDRALAAAREIVDRVAQEGDEALLAYEERFDSVRPPRLVLSRDELEAAAARIPFDLLEALREVMPWRG